MTNDDAKGDDKGGSSQPYYDDDDVNAITLNEDVVDMILQEEYQNLKKQGVRDFGGPRQWIRGEETWRRFAEDAINDLDKRDAIDKIDAPLRGLYHRYFGQIEYADEQAEYFEKKLVQASIDFELKKREVLRKRALLTKPMTFTADKILQTIEEIQASKASSSKGGRQGRMQSLIEKFRNWRKKDPKDPEEDPDMRWAE